MDWTSFGLTILSTFSRAAWRITRLPPRILGSAQPVVYGVQGGLRAYYEPGRTAVASRLDHNRGGGCWLMFGTLAGALSGRKIPFGPQSIHRHCRWADCWSRSDDSDRVDRFCTTI